MSIVLDQITTTFKYLLIWTTYIYIKLIYCKHFYFQVFHGQDQKKSPDHTS